MNTGSQKVEMIIFKGELEKWTIFEVFLKNGDLHPLSIV